MIRERLRGRRVLLTGATGFLGTALLERLLVDVPVDRIDVLIRGNAEARANRLLGSSAFAPARERLGAEGLKELAATKLRPVSGALGGDAPPVSEDADLVIHTAATVSFDPPIDEAFRTNLSGSVSLFEVCRGRPFIHVSTAYVAGSTRGTQHEEPLGRSVDWRAEASAAVDLRTNVERSSRMPEVLQDVIARARTERGRAGPQSVAKRSERLRRDWVRDRLVDAGRERARSMGWPDVYTFSKALTEMALLELAGDAPLTIVRPSIIESALEHPSPGWIEGFRMAEPVILGFGRGSLPDFPGSPDTVIDVIPVDLVVNAVLAVAARSPENGAVYHISSGARNPLSFGELYEVTRDYFQAQPLPDRGRGEIKVPEWQFRGRDRLNRALKTTDRVLDLAESVVVRLPRNRVGRETVRRLDRLRGRLDFAARYSELYGPYTELDVIYTDDRCRSLFDSLPPEDKDDFSFDVTSFDWRHYLHDVHLPSITSSTRWALSTKRIEPRVKIRGERPQPVLAVFDIEGTVVDSNVVEPYLWMRLSDTTGFDRFKRVAEIASRVPRWIKLDRRERGEFLRHFYRQYEGVDAEEVKSLASEVLGDLVFRRISPGAVRRVREHRAAGHRVVFVTASLGFIVQHLAPLCDEIVAANLVERNGLLTGDMDGPPLVGEGRASWLRDYARTHEANLRESYAYADSMSDLPLLEAVGSPVAVNPDVRLAREARRRRWPIEEWPTDQGTPRILMPGLRA
ncbi:MAG TPA: HAD-IB family hydrolase [Actinomycetota bacterium]|nr:HAD-IB family hydrolase [Actinomycetota bacterium]